METLLIALRFVQFSAVLALFGTALFPFYAGQAGRGTVRFVRQLVWVTALLALVSALGWLGCEATLMSGDPLGFARPDIIGTVLQQTEFGRIWEVRLLILGLLPAYLLIGSKKSALIFSAAFVLLASLAGIGHGAQGNDDLWLHLGVQAVHLLAAGTWVGGLLPLLYVTGQTKAGLVSPVELLALLKRFSALGLAAVLLIVASGCANSFFLVGSWHALLHSPYGTVLLLKITCFAATLGLALLNRCYLMPRLPGATKMLGQAIGLELALTVIILGIVSVLGNMMPPFEMGDMRT